MSGPSTDPAEAPPLEGVRLEPMAERHLDRVLAIEERSFPSPWRRSHFQFELHDNPCAENWVLECEGRLLGYLAAWRIEDEFKINNVAVHPDYRCRGLAGWMLRQVLRVARAAGCASCTLEVRVSNAPARQLYGRLGFAEYGRRKGYYQREGEDAILMELDLRGADGRNA